MYECVFLVRSSLVETPGSGVGRVYSEDSQSKLDKFPQLGSKYECISEQFLFLQVAPKIKERMMRSGSMMVTYQPLRTFPNFFRIVYQSSSLTNNDILYFLDKLEELGQDL